MHKGNRPKGLDAMILAAGRGERMRPLSDRIPKPLLPVGGQPLIVHHLLRLSRAGYTRVVINLAHLGEQISKRLGDGSEWGLEILYSEEEHALETGGGIRKALPLLRSNPFLVINGDVWCDHSLRPPCMDRHDLAHLLLVENPTHKPEGDFSLIDASKTPLRDQDFPRVAPRMNHGLTFAGIGWYRAELFLARAPGRFALAPLLFEAMAEDRVSGEHYPGIWMDIGTPERLAMLDQMLSAGNALAPVGPKP